MSLGSLGSLVVSVGLDAAQFVDGMTKAEYQTRKSMQNIEASVKSASHIIESLAAALGVGFGVDAFAGMVKSSLDAEAALAIVGARAGLTGEQMSALSTPAAKARTSLDDMASMSERLSKALLESENPTSKSALALRVLGINSGDAAKLLANPLVAIQTLARSLSDLPEGGTKAALQLLLLGKSGGTTSAALAEVAKQTDLVASRTQAEIEAAKAFADQLVEVDDRTSRLKTSLANALLPTLVDTLEAFVKLQSGVGGASDLLSRFTADGTIKEWSRNTVLALATVAEALVLVIRLASTVPNAFKSVGEDIKVGLSALNISGATGPEVMAAKLLGIDISDFKRVLAERNKVVADANKNLLDLYNSNGTALTDAIRKQFAASDAIVSTPPEKNLRQQEAADAAAKAKEKAARDLINSFNRGTGDDPTKKILDAGLKALDASIAEEKSTLQARDEFLKQYYDAGYITLQDYYAKRDAAISEGLKFDETAYDQEIALVKRFIANSTKETDKAQGSLLLVEITKKRTLAEQDAAKQGVNLWFEQQKAAESYRHTIESLIADVLDLQGETAAAAKIRLASQDEAVRKTLTADTSPQGAAGLAALNAKERLLQIQNELNFSVQRYSLITGTVGIAQARIDLEQQTGAITEIEAINKRSDLAKQYISILTKEIDVQAALVAGMDAGPAKNAALLNIEQLKLQVDQLAASTDVLAKKFNDVFSGAASDALVAIVTRTKSVKDALTDALKSIDQQIAKFAADQVTQSLFAKGGALGGVGDFFAGIFGGGSSATGTAGVAALGTTAGTSATALAAMTAAANAASAALASVGTSGGASGLSDIFSGDSGDNGLLGGLLPDFGSIFGFASGGDPPVGKVSIVGENGPELFVPKSSGTVIPITSAKRAGGDTYHMPITVNVPQGTSRASATQIGLAVSVHAKRGLGRNG